MSPQWTPQNLDTSIFATWLRCSDNLPAPYSDKTIRVYLSVVLGLLVFLRKGNITSFRDFDVDSARTFAVQNVETGQPYAQAYQTLRLSALNAFWHWLIDNGIANDNPVESLINERRLTKGHPISKPSPRVLTWSEQRLLLRAVQESSSRTAVRDLALFTLLLATGLLCDELCSLKLLDLDLNMRRLKIVEEPGKERVVDFTHDILAVDALEQWLKQREMMLSTFSTSSDVLFITVTGNPMTESLVYQQVSKYLGLAGLGEHLKHGTRLLRHTAASIMFARHVPVWQIQENLGHEKASSTRIYDRLLPNGSSQLAAI